MMEKKKSNHLAASIICGVLTAFGIAVSIISLARGENIITTINEVLNLVTIILIGYYALYGYRKPNGNLLKYIILLYTIPFVISVYSRAGKGDALQAVIRAVDVGLLCYMAGRLHRVKQNVVIMSIVTISILVFKIIKFAEGNASISTFFSMVIWIDICVAYVLRYKDHKLAGLKDKE